MTALFDQDSDENRECDPDDMPVQMPIEEIPSGNHASVMNFAWSIEAHHLVNQLDAGWPTPAERLEDVWTLIRYRTLLLSQTAQAFPPIDNDDTLDDSAWMSATLADVKTTEDEQLTIQAWWEIPLLRRSMAYSALVEMLTNTQSGLGNPAIAINYLSQMESRLIEQVHIAGMGAHDFEHYPSFAAALNRAEDPFDDEADYDG